MWHLFTMVGSMIPEVLYEDNHVIAVNKPAGVLVQSDETGDDCLLDMVKKYVKETYQKSGNVFLGLIHRLDRPVSGIVLFAKTSKGASRLSEQFRSHTVVKRYTALVEGYPKENVGTLIHYLQKNHETNIVTVYDTEVPGALYAELSYRVLQKGEKTSLIEIQLKTGRPHQIRAQLSRIGCPIVGDIKYGAAAPLADKTIALSATYLSFTTATRNERKELLLRPPFTIR